MVIAMESETSSDQRPVIQAREILAKIKRGEDVEYDSVIVEGDLDISGQKLIFSEIIITNSNFNGKVSLDNAHFHESVNFMGSEFNGNAYFEKSEFFENVQFSRTTFRGYAYFEKAKFHGEAYFGNAKFTNSNVNFIGVDFSRDAYFPRANFGVSATFTLSKFCGYADFQEVEFTEDVNFAGLVVVGDANFWGAKFKKELRFDYSSFKILYITWDSIKDQLVYHGPAYLALVKNFKDIERFGDADDCYYQSRKESQALKKWHKEKQFNWSKLHDWIGFVSCGYGVRLYPIFFWVLGSVLGFTLLYKLLPESRGGIAASGPSTLTMEAMNNSTLLFTFGSGDGVISPSWGDCLYFSFTALTGGTPDGLHPVGLVKYAVMVESVLGYLFLALFVVVLARKIIR